MIEALTTSVTVVQKKEFEKHLPKAYNIMRDIDEDDISFLALAISFSNDGIWSDDRDFQRQKEVRIWRTGELIDLL